MTGGNDYHIYLHLDELTDTSAMTGTQGSVGGAEQSENVGGSITAEMAAGAAKKMISFAVVASTADKIISHEINQVSLRTGATQYEQRLNAAYSIGRDVAGAAVSLGVGFAAGGPAGLAVAAAGVVLSGFNKMITLSQNREVLRDQRDLENISIGMYNIRAGTVGRRSREQ